MDSILYDLIIAQVVACNERVFMASAGQIRAFLQKNGPQQFYNSVDTRTYTIIPLGDGCGWKSIAPDPADQPEGFKDKTVPPPEPLPDPKVPRGMRHRYTGYR